MSYNIQYPYSLIIAHSMTSTFTSAAFNIINQDNIGLQFDWTGSPTGVLSIAVSNNHQQDNMGNIKVAGTFITIPSSLFSGNYPVPSGSASDGYLDINQTGAYWLNVTYTATSGTGLLTCVLTAKAI